MPDTEEASDSFMSSMDTPSPRPPSDSDEGANIAKEFMEEIKKMSTGMEVDIDEVKRAAEMELQESPEEIQSIPSSELSPEEVCLVI